MYHYRYQTVNFRHFSPSQVRHQYDGADQKYLDDIVKVSEQKSKKYGKSQINATPYTLTLHVLKLILQHCYSAKIEHPFHDF